MSNLPARYESFLVMNAPTIGTIESSLRSLTWFLPGRFKDAEIVSEARELPFLFKLESSPAHSNSYSTIFSSVNSTLNLLSLYHDTLLARRLALVKSTSPKAATDIIPSSAHSRYTRGWSERDQIYKWSARGLEVVRFTQLVMEMLLKRVTGRSGRWRGIFLLELTKALLRLVLLQRTKRPVLSPPIPERDVDPTSLPALADLESQSPPLKPAAIPSQPPAEDQGIRPIPPHLSNNRVPFNPTGKPHPLLSSLSSSPLTRTVIEEYLLPKALTPSSIRPPTSLLQPIKGVAHWASELIYILQPLIYVTMLRPTNSNLTLSGGHLSTSITHNKPSVANMLRTPLAISISLSILSRHLRRQPPASPSSLNSLERQEYARRDRELIWYLFRGEVWSEWTRPKIENFSRSLEGKPLLGLLAGVIQDWVPLVDEYWYYTAT